MFSTFYRLSGLTSLFAAALVIFATVTAHDAIAQSPMAVERSGNTFHIKACSTPSKPGFARCHAHAVTDEVGKIKSRPKSDFLQPNSIVPMTPPPGFGPTDLRTAYAITSDGSSNMIIAIVDAYGYPNAESDLAVYRSIYGLPECSKLNGCFIKVDQNGGTSYPVYNNGWAQEQALDLDMVSAICPACKILLVQAASNSFADLATAVQTAARLGAHAISNSYGAPEGNYSGTAYDIPGVAITVSSGDNGYRVEWPSALPTVTAVGGTSLYRDTSSRGWRETAWSGAGSGCSLYYPKPSWQTDSGCARRTVADVSAVADPATGVAVYGPNGSGISSWMVFGGTSASAPIIAAIYGINGGTVDRGWNPYRHIGNLNDVSGGSNGTCSGSYLCTSMIGYDGPTGLGTPSGTFAFGEGSSFQLSYTKNGSAPGTVTSVPSGMNCSTSCNISFAPNTSVQLTATAGIGGTFTGWSGACTGNAACLIAMSGNSSVTASFAAVTVVDLNYPSSGTGAGTVTVSPSGLSCGATCQRFNINTPVTLTATPAADATFTSWTNCPVPSGATCSTPLNSTQTITANFTMLPKSALSVTRSGTGGGNVTAASAGLNCGPTCSAQVLTGANVQLTATASPGSVFAGWTGSPSCGALSTCTVKVDANTVLNAIFNSTAPQVALTNGVAVTNLSGTTTSQTVFTFSVPSAAYNLQFMTAGGSGNINLYVKRNSIPTTSSYDCASIASGTVERCAMTATAGTYYVLVTGSGKTPVVDGFNYASLVAGFTTSNVTLKSLANGSTLTKQSASRGQNLYYSIFVPMNATNFQTSISGGSGDADLYVRNGALPTSSLYDCRPYLVGNSESCSWSKPSAGLYYVMLNGYSSFSGLSLLSRYTSN